MLNEFDSDSTYCSEVEEFPKAEKKINNFILRRSQRLLQNTNIEKFNSKYYETTSKFRCRNGSSQLNLGGVVDGSTDKSQEQFSLNTFSHSRDILEQYQNESFSAKIPLNQKYYTTAVSCNRNSNSNSGIYAKNEKRKIEQDLERLILMENNTAPSTLHNTGKRIRKDATHVAPTEIRSAALENKVKSIKNNIDMEDTIATCPIDNSNQISNISNSKDVEVGEKSTKRASNKGNIKRTKPVQKAQSCAKQSPTDASENVNKLIIASNGIENQQTTQQRKKRGRKPKRLNDNEYKVNKNKKEYFMKYADHCGNQSRKITTMPTIQPTNQKSQNFHKRILPPTMNYDTVRQSLLPTIYPPHFQHQLMPTAPSAMAASLSLNVTAGLMSSTNEPNLFLTPEISQILQHPTPSTAQSSPDSLSDLFDSTEIREILNIEKVTYRLTEHHVQALAIVLNLKYEYLCGVFEKILKLNSNTLQRIDDIFKMTKELDEMATEKCTARSVSLSVSEISNSQSPVSQRYFPSQKET